MRSIHFGVAWTFILLTGAYDGYFAWQYRAALAVWELNPVVRWTVDLVGLEAVLGLKYIGIAFAAGLAIHCHCRRHRLEKPLTMIIAATYLLLAALYVVGHLQPLGSRDDKSLAVAGPGAPPAFSSPRLP
jgi:hypothetical protein